MTPYMLSTCIFPVDEARQATTMKLLILKDQIQLIAKDGILDIF
jgi:hypothetical protein